MFQNFVFDKGLCKKIEVSEILLQQLYPTSTTTEAEKEKIGVTSAVKHSPTRSRKEGKVIRTGHYLEISVQFQLLV